MRAFTDTQVSKEELLTSLAKHAAMDDFVKGDYWSLEGKGCAVGCTLHDFAPGKEVEHELYEKLFGIPHVLVHLEDSIFEGLDVQTSKAWPIRFAEAVPVGSDLGMVWPKFALWLLREKLPAWTKDEESLAVIKGVAKLYERWIKGEKPATEEWKKVRDAATFYASSARDVAADAAAYATYAYANSASDVTISAAYAAIYAPCNSVAADADCERFWCDAADKLEELLRAAGGGIGMTTREPITIAVQWMADEITLPKIGETNV